MTWGIAFIGGPIYGGGAPVLRREHDCEAMFLMAMPWHGLSNDDRVSLKEQVTHSGILRAVTLFMLLLFSWTLSVHLLQARYGQHACGNITMLTCPHHCCIKCTHRS